MFMSFQVSFVERKIHFCSRLYDLSFKVYFVSSSTQKEGRECSAPKAAPPKREVLQFGAILNCFSSVFNLISSQATKEERQHHPKEAEERSTTQKEGRGKRHNPKGGGRSSTNPKERRQTQPPLWFILLYCRCCSVVWCVLKMCVRVLKVCGVWV